MASVGFPTPTTRTPTSADEAITAAESIGYPVVAKPRSHVAVGVARGDVLRCREAIERSFSPYALGSGQTRALRHDAQLAWPVLQQFMDREEVEVISVTGCLNRHGELMAVSHSKKTNLWPPGLGVGTRFEFLGRQTFTDHAVDAVAQILGSGIFELEVLFDRRTGEYWAIDLNPRAFGQISLDVASGNDLPVLWYRSVTDDETVPAYISQEHRNTWTMGMPYAAELIVGLVQGPRRRSAIAGALGALKQRSVGASFDRRDPRPALAFGYSFLRHPGGLVRPFLRAAANSDPSRRRETGEGDRTNDVFVTVVIPTFRRNELLRNAISSALGGGISSIEVLVIDDSPEQGARDVIAEFGDDRVKYLSNPNPTGGVPAIVRNLGIDAASGRYLYFLDDDDRVTEGGLSALAEALENNPARGVAFGTVRCVGPDEVVRRGYQDWFDWAARSAGRTKSSRMLTVGVIMFRGTTIINSCCMIRTDLARTISGYDVSIPVYEDVDFFARGIRRAGHVFVPQPVLLYTTGLPSIIHDLAGDTGPIDTSYRMIHDKYKAAHGVVAYRATAVVFSASPAWKAFNRLSCRCGATRGMSPAGGHAKERIASGSAMCRSPQMFGISSR